MFCMNRNITVGTFVIVLFTTTPAIAQNDNVKSIQPLTGDPVAGKSKSLLCQGCHGEDGNSLTSLIPKLAGQNEGYIIKQVHNFQAGVRKHAIMNDLAMTVNDEDLADIAAYFASRPKMKGEGSNNKVGKMLFLHGDISRTLVPCVNCHGANGKGLEPNSSMFPVIGGQQKDYLRRQLENFRKDERTNSPNEIMNRITRELTDSELEALADYISGQ
jgi:cytochrome c553